MPYVQGHYQEWSLEDTLGHPSQLRASIPASPSISRDIWLYKWGPVTDKIGLIQPLCTTAFGCHIHAVPSCCRKPGSEPCHEPLGQGKGFLSSSSQGNCAQGQYSNTKDKGHQRLSLLAPLGFLLLGNAIVVFAQTSDAPGVPGCCRVASVAKWQPQMCWDGGPRHRFLS